MTTPNSQHRAAPAAPDTQEIAMTTDTTPALLPCPFCGSQYIDASGAQVVCGRCNSGTAVEDSLPKAIAAWNRRAAPAADDLRAAETAAWAMWKEEAAEGTPKSIYQARTIEAFRADLNPDDQERWLRKGRAVVAALAAQAGGRE